MGGTKIVVVQLKELIKSALFALGGLVLIILLIYFLVPKSGGGEGDISESMAAAKYIPGTYAAQIILHNYPVDVLVTVTEKEITSVALSDIPESQEVFYPLFKPTIESLSEEIIKNQSTNVTTTQETEFTSKVLIAAINAALEKASYEAASTSFE